MAIDYTDKAFAIPKERPRKAERDDLKADIATKDKRESEKAKIRANGQCEVRVDGEWPGIGRTKPEPVTLRCHWRDTQTHHLIGGIGRRNRGKSILAEYKLRVCDKCHEAITGKTLQPTTADHTAFTVRFRWVR